MKIRAIELRRISVPLITPFRTSFGVEPDRDAVMVRIITDEAEGWGECVSGSEPLYCSEYADGSWMVLEHHIIPRLFAASNDIDGLSVERILGPIDGHRMSKAAVEIAVLDAQTRAAGQSLQAFLGGTRELVETGVSVGIHDNIDELLTTVAGFVDDGYTRIKLKVEPGNDIEHVRAVHQMVAGRVRLQVDANCAYTRADIAHLTMFDEFDLLLIEQPFAMDDLVTHAELRKVSSTPVCLDEAIESLHILDTAIALGAVDVVNIKPGRIGGWIEARRIHDRCVEHGIPLWHGGMLETGIGRAANVALASLPGFTLPGDLSASDRYFHQDLTEKFVLENGHLRVPTTPGIGRAPLPEILERFTSRVTTFRP